MADFSPFVRRRERTLAEIGQGVLVLFAAGHSIRNNDVTYEFRQDSDFYYLTGLDEPDSVLVLLGGEQPRSVLFVSPRDPEREVWEGARLGIEGATALAIDEAFSIHELDERLPRLLSDRPSVFCRFGGEPFIDARLGRALGVTRQKARRGAGSPAQLVDFGTIVHEHRRIKDENEVALLQRAVDITSEAHLSAMARARPGMHEYEIEALLRGIFRSRGSERVAYEPIVGAGPNGTVLHYVQNRRQIGEGELLLIDAGCEYGYYAADVTRTFPASGRFSDAQRQVYDIVLAAQYAGIAAAGPGATLETIHQAVTRVICEGLVKIGVLSGSAAQAEAEGSYKRFFMHKTSHYLGMDVHDVGSYFDGGKARPLDPGVVITVEPGLYFGLELADVDPRYRGIGIRIEDDVLIEKAGVRVLSSGVPKEAEEVERACRA